MVETKYMYLMIWYDAINFHMYSVGVLMSMEVIGGHVGMARIEGCALNTLLGSQRGAYENIASHASTYINLNGRAEGTGESESKHMMPA